jgi:hypothetical protein
MIAVVNIATRSALRGGSLPERAAEIPEERPPCN